MSDSRVERGKTVVKNSDRQHRTGEWREGFAFASTHNNLNQITNRAWSGTLTVSGYVTNKINPLQRGAGVQTVDVNMQAASPGGQGGYVADGMQVTSSKTQAMTNNVITAVNKDAPLPRIGDTKSLDKKSIKWEKINVEPSVMVPTYDQRGNLLYDGVRTYTWNGYNQIISIQVYQAGGMGSGFRSDYAYDGMGRKVRAIDSEYVSGQWTVTSDLWYLYDGWNCIAEIDHQSSSRQVIHVGPRSQWQSFGSRWSRRSIIHPAQMVLKTATFSSLGQTAASSSNQHHNLLCLLRRQWECGQSA